MNRVYLAVITGLLVAVAILAHKIPDEPQPVYLSVDKMLVEACPVKPWRGGRRV